MSWTASPAALHPGSTTTTQLIALADRILADEDRTRRAHSFLAPLLAVASRAVVATIVAASVVIVGLALGGSACLVLGLYGVGPSDGALLARLGGAGTGLGAIATIAGIIRARRWWTALRGQASLVAGARKAEEEQGGSAPHPGPPSVGVGERERGP